MMKDETPDLKQLLEIIAGKDNEIVILRSQVAERDAIISDIKQSMAWKLTYPYRVIAGGLKIIVRATWLLFTSPREFSFSVIRRIAKYVRQRPGLRSRVRKTLSRFPEGWQRRLAIIAPPSQKEISDVSVFEYRAQKELLGEALWVFRGLSGRA